MARKVTPARRAALAALAEQAEALATDIREALAESDTPVISHHAAMTWRERVWDCAADTRMSVRDVCEAFEKVGKKRLTGISCDAAGPVGLRTPSAGAGS